MAIVSTLKRSSLRWENFLIDTNLYRTITKKTSSFYMPNACLNGALTLSKLCLESWDHDPICHFDLRFYFDPIWHHFDPICDIKFLASIGIHKNTHEIKLLYDGYSSLSWITLPTNFSLSEMQIFFVYLHDLIFPKYPKWNIFVIGYPKWDQLQNVG
mgnify:CR=1 FL=1